MQLFCFLCEFTKFETFDEVTIWLELMKLINEKNMGTQTHGIE